MGTFRLTSDPKTKIVRGEWVGKFDPDEWEKTFERSINELKKFPKGESMALGVTMDIDQKFLTADMVSDVNDFVEFASRHCKKIATVVPSFMLQKSLEQAADYTTSNNRMFIYEREAVKWLLEN